MYFFGSVHVLLYMGVWCLSYDNFPIVVHDTNQHSETPSKDNLLLQQYDTPAGSFTSYRKLDEYTYLYVSYRIPLYHMI